MQEIYIDVVFAANLLMDYLSPRAAGGKILKMPHQSQTLSGCRHPGGFWFLPDPLYPFGKYSGADSCSSWLLCTSDASDRT